MEVFVHVFSLIFNIDTPCNKNGVHQFFPFVLAWASLISYVISLPMLNKKVIITFKITYGNIRI